MAGKKYFKKYKVRVSALDWYVFYVGRPHG